MTKQILLIITILLSVVNFSHAQNADTTAPAVSAKDTAWKKGALLNFTFGQTYLSDNWAGGGEPSYALNSKANLFANYEYGKLLWQNKLDMSYGFVQQQTSGFKKNDDVFEFTSNFGYKASKKWYYSILFSAKSQFDEGIKYTDTDTTRISDYLSPLTLNLAPGMTYKHNEYFQAFLTPVNLRFVYVNDIAFSELNSLEPGEHWRKELGFLAKFNYKRNFTETLSFLSNLDLFYDYLDPKAPVMNWEVLINIKVYKVLSVNLNTVLVYDENVQEENDAGDLESVGVQFKEVFGAGLAINF